MAHRTRTTAPVRAKMGGPSVPESERGSPPDGRAAPHPGAANTQTAAKVKNSQNTLQPEHLPLTPHPLPHRSPLAA